MRNLKGKRALITGAASGIGRAIALQLAAEQTHVYLLDIDEAGAELVAAECRALGVEAVAKRCDVTQSTQISAVIADMLQQWPAIDLLVNNVGVAYYGPTENMTAAQWNWLLGINLLAPLQFTRELLPTLLAQPEAHILNISSIAGLVAGGRFTAYHVSKFGLVGFTEALRAEYVRRGLGATVVCPGPVQTKLYERAVSGRANKRVPVPPAWASATPEQVARKAIRGIKRNRALVLVTPMAHVLAMFKRLLPGLLDWVNCMGRRKPQQAAAGEFAAGQTSAVTPGLRIAEQTTALATVADQPDGVERVTFNSRGTVCEGWLMRASSCDHPAPLVIMAHGFAAEKSFGLLPYARQFAQRGMAVLMFDYRHFGGSGGVPRNLVNCRRQQQDWQAALKFGKGLAGIDPQRVALWGSSFGGGHAVHCAAQNADVAAVIAQVPMLDVPRALRGYTLRYGIQAIAHGVYDLLRAAVGRTPHRVPVVGDSPAFAVMNKPGCQSGYKKLLPHQTAWQNSVPARILLASLFHRPIKQAARVRCPVLVVMAENDQLIPAKLLRMQVAQFGDVELLTVDGDHFSPYHGEVFQTVVAAHNEFLENCLVNARTLSISAHGQTVSGGMGSRAA